MSALALIASILMVGALPAGGAGGAGSAGDARTDVAALLDRFHAAAARADESAYFACFAPNGVFLGTDASERWTVEEFRAYAHPHFAAGKGWTYAPKERHVELSDDGRVAWFDEILSNEKYGLCRGTGVAIRAKDAWLVAHYSLTFLVPNDAASAVVAAISDNGKSTDSQKP